MTIAVVLPCFNAADTLAIQLEALTRQSWSSDVEILLVDNGSTDGSVELFERYRPRLPKSRVIQAYDPALGRQGVASSYALAIRESDADRFLLCEADDEVADNWFEVLSAALEHDDLAAAAIDYTRLNDPELYPAGQGMQSLEAGLPVFPGTGVLYATGCSLGFTRRVVDAIGLPDPDMEASWDTDYCLRAAEAGLTLGFVTDTVVHYRLRTGGKGRFKQGRNWGRGFMLVQRKYRYLSPARAFLITVRRYLRAVRRFGGVLTGRRTLRRWVWYLGFAVGTGDTALQPRLERPVRGRVGRSRMPKPTGIH